VAAVRVASGSAVATVVRGTTVQQERGRRGRATWRLICALMGV